MENNWKEQLAALAKNSFSLNVAADILRKIKAANIDNETVLAQLGEMRGAVQNEAEEDRILEIMDIAAGYCSERYKVW